MHTPTLTGPQEASKLCRGGPLAGFLIPGWPGALCHSEPGAAPLPWVRRPLPNLKALRGFQGPRRPNNRAEVGLGRERGTCWGRGRPSAAGVAGAGCMGSGRCNPISGLCHSGGRGPEPGAGPFKRGARPHQSRTAGKARVQWREVDGGGAPSSICLPGGLCLSLWPGTLSCTGRPAALWAGGNPQFRARTGARPRQGRSWAGRRHPRPPTRLLPPRVYPSLLPLSSRPRSSSRPRPQPPFSCAWLRGRLGSRPWKERSSQT